MQTDQKKTQPAPIVTPSKETMPDHDHVAPEHKPTVSAPTVSPSRQTMPREDYDDAADDGAVRREVRASRDRLGTTVQEMKRRLSPDRLKEQTMNRMYRSAHDASASVSEVVRHNPVPIALIGAGLGWLLLSRTHAVERVAHSEAARRVGRSVRGAARYARDTAYSARDTAYEAGEAVRDTASHAYDQASDVAHEARDAVADRYGRVTGRAARTVNQVDLGERWNRAAHGFWDMVDEHPLVAGVMGAALGAAIGASIPASRTEDRWVGGYADEAYERAKHLAEDAMGRATRAAHAAVDTAREDLAEVADDVKQAAKAELKRS